MKKNFLFAACFITLFSRAQVNSPEVVASGGEYFTGSNFTNSYTIGEMATVRSVFLGTFILTQGFQQPDYGPTSVISGTAFSALSFYPNPTSGQITILYNTSGPSVVRFEVLDLLGQAVLQESAEQAPGPQSRRLDLSAFESGTYIVRCTVTGEKQTSVLMARAALVK